MNTQEKEQVFMLLQNIEENRKRIPTFSDLKEHSVFGAGFVAMSEKEAEEVKSVINAYIEKRIYTFNKTKG
jgi:hypothetical protein